MAQISANDLNGFIRQLAENTALRAVLVYGGDVGGIQETAQRIARAWLKEAADDALAVQVLDEEQLKEDPGLLADEAQAISMFGGRRLVKVRDAGSAFLKALKAVLKLPAQEALIVALAPGLKKEAALARLFIKEKQLAAVPVYGDSGDNIRRLADAILAEHGLRLEHDAWLALQPLLGADRLATRNEVEKLALYCRGQERVTLDDVRAVCSDVSAHMMNDMLDAFFSGQAEQGVRLFQALLGEGVHAAGMLAAAAHHVARLKELRAVMAEGVNARQVVLNARPPIFFRRRDVMIRQLNTWTEQDLAQADESIWQATHRSRQIPELDAAIAERCLMALALHAGRRRAA